MIDMHSEWIHLANCVYITNQLKVISFSFFFFFYIFLCNNMLHGTMDMVGHEESLPSPTGPCAPSNSSRAAIDWIMSNRLNVFCRSHPPIIIIKMVPSFPLVIHQTIITTTTNLIIIIIIIRIIQIISYLFRKAIHQIVRQTSGKIHFYILN